VISSSAFLYIYFGDTSLDNDSLTNAGFIEIALIMIMILVNFCPVIYYNAVAIKKFFYGLYKKTPIYKAKLYEWRNMKI